MTLRSAGTSSETVLAFDRAHVWHPYDSATAPGPVRLVESARGARLTLADGREVVDAMSSWWCAIHGYRHPVLDLALREQADQMSHVMFGGLTHRPAVVLAEQLLAMTPAPLQHVFFADSGSVSVEVAIKLALQCQRGRGHPGRTRLLTVRGGYHGDTLGAMSVCDPVAGMHSAFAGTVPQQLFAPRPPPGFARAENDPELLGWIASTSRLVDEHTDELAAIVVEPVLQGAGGMYVYSPHCVAALRQLADEHGALLILDEIATGFGRTGTLFGADHAGVVPDVMCVGKALTGGYLTLAAVLCTGAVASAVSTGEPGALMHGPTFMANPLACAVASASIGLLLGSDGAGSGWAADVRRIEAGLRAGLAPASDLPGVRDVRVLGAVGVVQLDTPVDVPALTAAALRHGVWVRPFRDLVYAMPPYVCTDEDVRAITAGMLAAVEEAG